MNREIKYGTEAQTNIIEGIDSVANAVKVTLGPSGRNVLIRNNLDVPIITNDGVTIAKAIQLKDNTQDAGASLIISAANRTNNIAGDGTTTTTLLAQTMIHSYFDKDESEKKENVVKVQKDMIEASEEISDYLKEIATPVETIEDIQRVATISSGNEETGSLIAKAFEEAGEYGSVVVEDSKTGKDNLTNIQGMKIEMGSISSYLLNDRKEMKTEMKQTGLLLIQDRIDSVPDLFRVLDIINKSGRALLIICDDIDIEPLQMVIMNKSRGVLSNIGIIKCPGFGQLKEDLLEDLSIATGATIISQDRGVYLRDFQESFLGELSSVSISLDTTIIKFIDQYNSEGTIIDLAKARQDRVEELQNLISMNKDRETECKRRIANLVGGISVIEVGGNSEVEIKDKKLRIEDALNSVQSAKEEGIVPGGGYSLIKTYIDKYSKEEITLGRSIVYKSILNVTRQIAENAGYQGDEIVNNCIDDQLGFNALTGEYENLIETGIINSAKVDRYSVLNATSLAATVITMQVSIVDENEPEQNVLTLQSPINMV